MPSGKKVSGDHIERDELLIDAILGFDDSPLDFSLCADESYFIRPAKRIAKFIDDSFVDFSLEGKENENEVKRANIIKYRAIVEAGGKLFE